MLVYEKRVLEDGELVNRLFGTVENIPSELDNQLVYKDASGNIISNLTPSSPTIKYVDDGNGGIIRIDSTDPSNIVETFIGVNIKKADGSLVNIIPGDSNLQEEVDPETDGETDGD